MLKRLPLIAVALVTAAITASPALAAPAPVGVWNFDEGSGTRVADSSGNGTNGVLTGGVSWVPGVSGSALSFNGSSGQVKMADNDALDPAGAVTVSAWFKEAGSPGAYRYILAKGANGCIAASYGLYTGPAGGLQFYVSQQKGTVYTRSPDAGQGVWDGKWHLAVGIYDGSAVSLYVDGVAVGSGTALSGSLDYVVPDPNLYIGNYPGCAPHGFLGAIDGVTIWNRALSASDVRTLMPGGPPSPPSGGGNQPGSGSGPTSGSGTPPGSGAGNGTTKTRNVTPSVSGLKLSAGTVNVDAHGHIASSGTTGLSITYTESLAARLTVTLLRSQTGERRGSRCVKPSAQARRFVHCSWFTVVTSVMRTDRAGHFTLSLSQLLHRKLSPGTYRLDVTPRANGKVGKTVSVRFVVRQARAHR
jgi:hypothetical protein